MIGSENSPNRVTVTIMDRKFEVVCPPEQIKELHEAARHLDQLMRQTRDASNLVGIDRIAVISALNLSHQLIDIKRNNNDAIHDMSDRINKLQERVEQTLSDEL